MPETAHPKKASTIILLRPDAGGQFEVFLTRRPADMDFLAGFYVFPGGRVEEEDYSEEVLTRCCGLSPREAQAILGDHLSAELSLGHWVAAIRELFEETGVLLCVTESGDLLDMRKKELKKRLDEKRAALVKAALGFGFLLGSEKLYCDLSRPVYFFHRVTPEKHAVRYDTRFYLAKLPASQSPLFSSEEVMESLWIRPDQVLRQHEKNDILLMPPTVIALRTLAEFDTWQKLSERYSLR